MKALKNMTTVAIATASNSHNTNLRYLVQTSHNNTQQQINIQTKPTNQLDKQTNKQTKLCLYLVQYHIWISSGSMPSIFLGWRCSQEYPN